MMKVFCSMTVRVALCVLLLGSLAPSAVAAGTLGTFERGFSSGGPGRVGPAAWTGADDLWWDLFLIPFIYGTYGGLWSMDRVNGTWEYGYEELVPRQEGDLLIPFVRMDGAWQFIDSDVSGFDFRGEAGYGAFAVSARHTYYQEDDDSDLALTQLYGLWRMSLGNRVELDLGLGSYFLDGNDEVSGFAMTLPLTISPNDYFSIELRPAWFELEEVTNGDFEIAVLTGSRYVNFKLGYRWLTTETSTLDGPLAGFSVHW
jgi:hypothetical protein